MADAEKLVAMLHPLERAVLPHVEQSTAFEDLAHKSKLQKVEVMRALQWLQNKKLVTIDEDLKTIIRLEENGRDYKKIGLPEWRFIKHTTKSPRALKEIKEKGLLKDQEVSICMGLLQKLKAVNVEKKDKELLFSLTEIGQDIRKKGLVDQDFLKRAFPVPVNNLNDDEKGALERLLKRKKIVKTDVHKDIFATITDLGKEAQKIGVPKNVKDQLTPELLASGKWKDANFRRYDVNINVPHIYGGKRHIVEQAIRYIKNVWLDLGFTEMQGNMIHTAFRDLDCLFVPQDHPAREMQDTFYVKDPASGRLPEELAQKVQAAHEHGGDTGSTGWGYKWSPEIAKENLLRTHNTVLSAETIARLKESDLPAKFFAVGKVFRNEALSWKHLFEFIQVEGIVVDPNANFKHLKGYLVEFFKKMGFDKIRARPGHFPYTEPSLEIDVWHPTKKQWVEVGGSGIFRPEMTQPLFGKPVPVIAWGLGMERSIMEYYGIKDVRDIYSNDLKQLREAKLWMK